MAIAVAGALLAPAFAFGQDSTVMARTHIVRRGDTLWDLARAYTSDPFRWKELYDLNTTVVRDPHWIYPGERLRLPGAATADATATTVRPLAFTERHDPPAAAPVAATTTPVVELAAAPIASLDGPTVFRKVSDDRSRPALARTARRSQAAERAEGPTIRAGEFIAAPWVESEGGPANAGRIVGSGEVPSVPLTQAERPLQSYERIFVVVPPGMSTATGTRYLAVRRGPVLEGVGQVMIPTGIVAVERAQQQQAVEARVVARFEPMQIGDQLVTMASIPANLPRPTAISGGTETEVLWVKGDPVLPSLRSYFVVAGGSSSGMRVGDQLMLYRERRTTDDGVVLPESEIAIAQVIRVTAQASTALIIDQQSGAIAEGTSARVSAKMP